MKVLYDGDIFAEQRFGGISRYFVELVKELRRVPGFEAVLPRAWYPNEYVAEVQGPEKPDPCPRYASFLVPFGFPGKPALYRRFRGRWQRRHGHRAALDRLLAKGDFDLLHPTYYGTSGPLPDTGRPMVLTVYDMIHERFPDLFASDPVGRLKADMIRRADHLVAISESTRRDLVEILGVEEEKISVVHLGCDPRPADPLPRPDRLPPRYLLYVGERKGYKNFWPFLEAFRSLAEEHPDLRLATLGRAFDEEESSRLASLGLEGRVVHFPATNEELEAGYQHAEAFVFPSRYEGFGLPVLEAMRAGCPCLLSRTSSLPEVGGDAALYFDPDNVEDIRRALEEFLATPALRESMRALGRERVRDFSWRKTAERTLDVYRRVIG